jgi:tetratricopeptide (TPR) repeat protein
MFENFPLAFLFLRTLMCDFTMIKKTVIVGLICISLCQHRVASAQNLKADSLVLILNSDKKDTSTIDELLQVADDLAKSGKFDDALKCAILSRRSSEQLSYEAGKAKSLAVSGAVYKFKGDHQAALNDLKESEVIYTKLHDYEGLGRIYNHLGGVYEDMSEFKKGLEHHLLSIDYYEKSGKGDGIASALIGAGINYYKRGSYKVALEYYLRALKVADSVGSVRHRANVLNNLGVVSEALLDYPNALKYYSQALILLEQLKLLPYVAKTYSNIAGINIAQGNYKEAKLNLDKAYKMRIAIGDKQQIYTLCNYGDLYRKTKMYDSAEYYYNQSLKLAHELNNLAGSLFPIRGLGRLYITTRQLTKANEEFKAAYNISKEIDSKPWLLDTYELKVKLDSAKGDYKSSFAWYKLYDHLNDSLFQFMVNEKIAYLESLTVQSKKDSSIQPEKESSMSRSILIWVCVGLALVLGIIIVLFILTVKKYSREPKELPIAN